MIKVIVNNYTTKMQEKSRGRNGQKFLRLGQRWIWIGKLGAGCRLLGTIDAIDPIGAVDAMVYLLSDR